MATTTPQSGTGVRESFSSEPGNVSKGLECRTKAAAVLEKFKLPAGLFPLATIDEFGFNETNGLLWMKQPAGSKQEFPDAEIIVHYGRAIHGYVEAQRLKNVVGFKVKDIKEKNLFVSVAYNEIKIDGAQVMLLSDRGEPRAFSSSVIRAAARPSAVATMPTSITPSSNTAATRLSTLAPTPEGEATRSSSVVPAPIAVAPRTNLLASTPSAVAPTPNLLASTPNAVATGTKPLVARPSALATTPSSIAPTPATTVGSAPNPVT